jgi:phosphoribosyl-ATP pyrophosphohydrolase/phosphoribosyl-AMP cyclohydrolase
VEVVYDDEGLIPAVVQDRITGQVRMVAYMSREALAKTIETGRATFYSRSRKQLWEKGQTSGNTLDVKAIYADCDADALLVLADPAGPTCHTGTPSCFFRRVRDDGTAEESGVDATAFLEELGRTIESRKGDSAEKSYTRYLLEGGAARIGAKVREEAAEFTNALEGESDERVASEAADVLYHLMVGLAARGLGLGEAIAALAARAGTSGHEEKARRR